MPDCPDQLKAFDAWADWRVLQPRPPSTKTLDLYLSFWSAWCRFLAAHETVWSDATPAQVVDYLRAEKRAVTQARYKRVLTEIYAFAVIQGWAAANPAQPDSPELPSREAPASTAMHLAMRDAFVAALAQEAREAVQLRDQVFVLLLAVEALSVSEALDVRLSTLRPSAARPTMLRLEGLRRAQNREVPLDARTGQAIRHWLAVAKPRMRADNAAGQPLLPDTRPAMWTRPLSRHAGFRIVRAALARAVELGHLATAPAEHGPRLLRNSAVLAWLEQGVSPVEAQRRAGLQRLDGLDRIAYRHASGEALERFKAQRQTERDAGLPQPAESPAKV